MLTQTRRVSLADALRLGETRTIEFKSTFQWDLRRDQFVEERRLDVLKSIAGFLNARGGTLFIGISEETNPPSLRGLNEDLKYVGGSRDKLQRTLRDLITTRIGPEFSPLIAGSLEDENDTPYWVVVVDESPEPAFVRWRFAGESKDQKKFYVREGPKTSDLDSERTWHYMKSKWG
jgi:predicted HTH transcriptional regulator